MSKTIDYRRVSNKLSMLYSGPDKNSNTITLWKKEFKDILNAQEVRRLFELFAGSFGYLIARTSVHMAWSKSANPCNWTPEWCKNVFDKHGIQSHYGCHVGPDGKALWKRKETSVSVEVKEISKTSEQRITKSLLSSISTEDLEKELNRRNEEKQAQSEIRDKWHRLKKNLRDYMKTLHVQSYEQLKQVATSMLNDMINLDALEKENQWLVTKKIK